MKEDIGIYTTEETLQHKKDFPGIVYWDLSGFRAENSLEEMQNADETVPKRLWFAVKGQWMGFFVVHHIWGNEIEFHPNTWTPIVDESKHPRKPFQGFTYKVPEVKDCTRLCKSCPEFNTDGGWKEGSGICKHKKRHTRENQYPVFEGDNKCFFNRPPVDHYMEVSGEE